MERYAKTSAISVIILFTFSCTYFQKEIYVPQTPELTSSLEAAWADIPPNTTNAGFWTTADYVEVEVTDIEKEQLSPDDGLLNVNGMYNGLADFNQGQPAELVLKAAYDHENLYILTTWKDNTNNASKGNWLYNGPADPLKDGDTAGWTSQRSNDEITFTFERNENSKDVWKWSLALSEPMGYAIDMVQSGQEMMYDSGEKLFERNASGTDPYRSGPKYEWNGDQQDVQRELSANTILDPGYYLLNKSEITADILNGEARYQQRCSFCHGDNGEGGGYFYSASPSLQEQGKYTRLTLAALDNSLADDSVHRGASYWRKLSLEEKEDVVARLRSFSGYPGYFLQTPSGSSSDVKAVSTANLARIGSGSGAGYKVLLIRKLQTGNEDDIQFNISQIRDYVFSIYLTDNDHRNLVGKTDLHLNFK
ncbi:MAG TPA: ethylbenzene dehydrogenase-related protein [Cyclobacteriaceae bacterium]|nr:ethylbenzene dehydrogenase-related protein [Cyclobacteriaceae bacterium]